MSETKLIHGDCLEKLKELPDCSVDSVVTDPPYGLSFMGKKWDYDVPSVGVWKECRLVTPPAGLVLDPFCWSGSTGKAAVLEGFQFIGIEREPKYFEIACRRIREAYAQPDLFIAPPEPKKTQESLL
jgi:DNA modification methylase